MSGECPPGTTQGNGGGEISPPEILFGETRLSGPARGTGQAAGSRKGSWMSLSPICTSPLRGERGGSRLSPARAARVTGDSSFCCQGAMATASTAPASRANTPPLIGLALITPRGAAGPRLLGSWGLAAPRISPVSSLYRDAFVRFRFAVSSSSPGRMRRVSLAVLWSCSLGSGCLQSHGSLSEVLGGPAQHWNTHSVGRDRLLLHDPYLPWAAMVPLTEIIRL